MFAPLPSAVPMPAYVPNNAPAAAIALPLMPTEIPRDLADAGFERWVRLVGGSGHVRHALMRVRDDETTLVGEHIVDLVDARELDAEIDAAVADQDGLLREHYSDDPEFLALLDVSTWRTFRLWDPLLQTCVFRCGSSSGADALPVDGLDGDELAWSVGHWRRRAPRGPPSEAAARSNAAISSRVGEDVHRRRRSAERTALFATGSDRAETTNT